MQVDSPARQAGLARHDDYSAAGLDGRAVELGREIVERFASMTVEDVRGRYAIGKLLLSLGAEGVPVARLAALVGCSTKALYQYGIVVKRFGEEELNDWLKRRTVDGQPPSWSHFVLLCSVPSRAGRSAILERWLAHPTGIRELAAELRARNGDAP